MKKKSENNPIIIELKAKIADCKIRLLDILDEWHVLQTEIQPKLIFTYESLFGSLESEVRVKNQVAIELDRRVELLSIKLKNGEELTDRTIKFIDSVVEREAKRIKRIKSRSYSKSPFILPNCEVNDNYELPQVYRKLVKKLHPDASGTETVEYQKFWDQIQVAYKSKDVERLSLYAQTLLDDEEQEMKDIRSERIKLSTEIHQLEVNINKAEKKLQMLKSEEPFCIEDKLSDSIWIARKKRHLQDKIFKLDRQILFKEKMLKSLTNGKYIAQKNENGGVKFIKREYTTSYAV
jgi:hypothetical protein